MFLIYSSLCTKVLNLAEYVRLKPDYCNSGVTRTFCSITARSKCPKEYFYSTKQRDAYAQK